MFEIDKNLNISAKGIIPDQLMVKESYRAWLEHMIAHFQEISTYYRKSIAGDGKLIGMEKNEIQSRLENFFLLVLSFIHKMKSESPDVFIPAGGDKEIYIQFISSSLWHIHGGISGSKLNGIRKFGDWFNQSFSGALKDFIEEFGKSQLDGVIANEEKDLVLKKASVLLLEVLMILVALEHIEIVK